MDFASQFPITIGRHIELDSTRFAQTIVASDWDAAPFRITTNARTWAGGPYMETASGYIELACRVEVTGRTVQIHRGARVVRVKVTYVGDGEPDTSTGGWMFV